MDALGCALLPAPCALCGSPLPRLSSVPICNACWAEIPALTGPVCPSCADRLEPGDCNSSHTVPPHLTLCRACRLAPPRFVRAVAYGPYQDRMRDAIHALKYQGLSSAARPLGGLLARAIASLAPDAPLEMLVVPVPLHRAKRAQRGFNQARLLAQYAIRFLHRTHPEWRLSLAPAIVVRLRSTDSQAGLSPHQRRRNLRGAFSVTHPHAVAGRHLLLIDDIFTTGATVRAVSRVLLDSGAASVRVATLARARLLQSTTHNAPTAPAVEASYPPPASMHASPTNHFLDEGKEDVAG